MLNKILPLILVFALLLFVMPLPAADAAGTTVTVMAYMDGSDLEVNDGSATADINEMLYADMGPNVNLILCVGGATEWQNSVVNPKTNEYYSVIGGQLVKVRDAGLKDMTRGETLTEFIAYCRDNYPADRYGLVMWNHGGGAVYGFGVDDRFPFHMMSVSELGEAVAAGGVHFDFIAFDACMMATAEMAAALAESADYMIASEEMAPGCGLYYTDWLTKLSRNPDMATALLGRDMIDGFMEKALEIDPHDILTMSLTDLQIFTRKTLPALWDFARATGEYIDQGSYAAVARARNFARSYGSEEYDQIDLSDFASRIELPASQALQADIGDCVLYNRATRNMEGSFGLAFYFPYILTDRVSDMIANYRALSFDESYVSLIASYASLKASGQSGQNADGTDWYDPDYVDEHMEYLADHQVGDDLRIFEKNGAYALTLSEEDWDLIVDIQLQVQANDGEGYVELGSDDEFVIDDDGDLVVDFDMTWLAVEGHTLAYYAEDYVEDGDYRCFTGRAPILYNGRMAYLILSWDSEQEGWYTRGVRLHTENTGPSARGLIPLRDGDLIQPVCRHYDYDGNFVGDSEFGDAFRVHGELTVGYEAIDFEKAAFCYRLEDIYGNYYWTEYVFVE